MAYGNQKYQSQSRQLRETEALTSEEKAAIQEFEEYDTGTNTANTVANHLLYLRQTAKRADFDITEVDDARELNDFLRDLQSGVHPDVKDDGIIVQNYVSALRVFYRYHDFGPDPRDIDVESSYSGRELSADDLLYREEVDRLFDAAQRESPRDLALLAILLATGQRKEAVRTLRLKHVSTDGPVMEVTLNEAEGDLKGASGTKPLLWAKHYVRPWYESHPHKGDPEAPLFPAKKRGQNLEQVSQSDKEDKFGTMYADRPISDSNFSATIKRRAEQAGIEKNVYPHLFRHSAITRMVAEGLSEQQIKNIVGWHGDSSQFETYVTLADEIATDSVRESLGLPTSESGPPEVGRPTLDGCPNCGEQLPEGAERCNTCQTPLTHEAAQAEAAEGADDGVREHYREADDMETVEKLQQLDDLLDDPEVRQLLEERMGDS